MAAGLRQSSGEESAKAEAKDSPERDPGLIAVARIVRPRGLRGEVVAEILTDFPSRFETQRQVFLESAKGPTPGEIESAWLHKGRVVLKFRGIDTINQAELLRGSHVLISREEIGPLAAHQYYVWQLRGCVVWREASGGTEVVGTIEDVERTAGGELLHVSTSEGEELIPFAQAICKRVDLGAKIVVIDPPEDLLRLNSQSAKRRSFRSGL